MKGFEDIARGVVIVFAFAIIFLIMKLMCGHIADASPTGLGISIPFFLD